jgi:hypothetical protein
MVDEPEPCCVPPAKLTRAVRLTAAAKATLAAAAAHLPANTNSIDERASGIGFTRISHEREQHAEKQIMPDRGR